MIASFGVWMAGELLIVTKIHVYRVKNVKRFVNFLDLALHLLYLTSLDNLNSFLSKHIVMTNSQKTKEKINEKVTLTDDSCCDDSCYAGGDPSVRFESEGRRGGGCC